MRSLLQHNSRCGRPPGFRARLGRDPGARAGRLRSASPQSYPLHHYPIPKKPSSVVQQPATCRTPRLEVPKVLLKGLLVRGGIDATKARLHRLLWLP